MPRPLDLLRGQQGVALGLLAQMLQYGAALLLLPFIVTRLPAAEVGIWYVFMTIQGLALLADFGFQPTAGRAIATAHGGAAELRAEGLSEAHNPEPNLELLAQVLAAVRRLYGWLAGLSLLLLLTAGLIYVSLLGAREGIDPERLRAAWVLFSIGIAGQLYLLWVSPLLLGVGLAASNYVFLIVSRGGFAVIGILALLAGGGLIGLAAANIAAIVLARLVATRLMRPVSRALAEAGRPRGATGILRLLLPNATRMGLVALSAFLITRSNVLILSTFVGLSEAAAYAISLQLFGAVAAVAVLPTQMILPRLVELRLTKRLRELRRVLLQRYAFLIVVFVAGSLFIILLGEPLLAAIGSRVAFLPREILLLLSVVLLLEAIHANAAFAIMTGNVVPFLTPALLSGAGVVLLSLGLTWAGWGVLGVVAAQGLVQLAYNNWRWPLWLWQETRS